MERRAAVPTGPHSPRRPHRRPRRLPPLLERVDRRPRPRCRTRRPLQRTTGARRTHQVGDARQPGEPVYVPGAGATNEDDDYLLTVVSDLEAGRLPTPRPRCRRPRPHRHRPPPAPRRRRPPRAWIPDTPTSRPGTGHNTQGPFQITLERPLTCDVPQRDGRRSPCRGRPRGATPGSRHAGRSAIHEHGRASLPLVGPDTRKAVLPCTRERPPTCE
ncbi:carotenoid oxygenase family protein [Streptomyces virginiae]